MSSIHLKNVMECVGFLGDFVAVIEWEFVEIARCGKTAGAGKNCDLIFFKKT